PAVRPGVGSFVKFAQLEGASTSHHPAGSRETRTTRLSDTAQRLLLDVADVHGRLLAQQPLPLVTRHGRPHRFRAATDTAESRAPAPVTFTPKINNHTTKTNSPAPPTCPTSKT